MSISEEQFLKKQSDFWSAIAQKWSLENKDPIVGWWSEHQAFQEYDTVLFRDMPLTGNEVVLEYGCGPARNLVRFSNRFARIDGVDISPEVIEKAKLYLRSKGFPEPNLWSNDGRSLPMIEDSQYDVVFMVISHQHITSRAVRLNLYKEFLRVLKPGGYLCFQTGYGPGHPRSVDYFADSHNSEADFVDKDVRCEDANHLKDDLVNSGFTWINATLTRTCKDEHPAWIWVQVQKP
jgi:SAM-dependent methyltransferase